MTTIVDVWVGAEREVGKTGEESVRNPQFFYDESQSIVKIASQRFIYGDITGMVTEEIS